MDRFFSLMYSLVNLPAFAKTVNRAGVPIATARHLLVPHPPLLPGRAPGYLRLYAANAIASGCIIYIVPTSW